MALVATHARDDDGAPPVLLSLLRSLTTLPCCCGFLMQVVLASRRATNPGTGPGPSKRWLTPVGLRLTVRDRDAVQRQMGRLHRGEVEVLGAVETRQPVVAR